MQTLASPVQVGSLQMEPGAAPLISLSNQWRTQLPASHLQAAINGSLREAHLPPALAAAPRPDTSTTQGRREALLQIRERRGAVTGLLASIPRLHELEVPLARSTNGRVEVRMLAGRPIVSLDADWSERASTMSVCDAVNECLARVPTQGAGA